MVLYLYFYAGAISFIGGLVALLFNISNYIKLAKSFGEDTALELDYCFYPQSLAQS